MDRKGFTARAACRRLAVPFVLYLAALPATAAAQSPQPRSTAGQPAAVQTSSPESVEALRREFEALKAAQASMQSDLLLIKAMLQRLLAQASGPQPGYPQPGGLPQPPLAAAPADLPMAMPDGAARGDERAKVALVEFSDFECPYCAQYVTQTYPQIDRDYVQAGKLRYVFVDYPIEQLHPNASKAHEAALCAGDQGKYWEMHDRLFANQTGLAPDALFAHAESVGVDAAKFRQCLSAAQHGARVRKSIATAQQIGIRGTPTFLIGLVEGGQFRAKKVLAGAQPYDAFKNAIDSVIAGK